MGVGGPQVTRGGDQQFSYMCSGALLLILTCILPCSDAVVTMGNPDAKRLYDDLLSNYNKLVRPVENTSDHLTVRIKLKLSQLIDVVSAINYEIEDKAICLACLSDSMTITHRIEVGQN